MATGSTTTTTTAGSATAAAFTGSSSSSARRFGSSEGNLPRQATAAAAQQQSPQYSLGRDGIERDRGLQQQQQQQQITAAGGVGVGTHQPQSQPHPLGPSSSARVQFVHRDLLACINCAPARPGDAETTRSSPSLFSTSTDRKLGPVLLELRQLELLDHHQYRYRRSVKEENKNNNDENDEYNDDDDRHRRREGGLFRTVTVCQSRSNPSLGTSLSSTCLQVMPLTGNGATTMNTVPTVVVPLAEGSLAEPSLVPPPCATGLTTGALCLHVFKRDDSSSLTSSLVSSIEYFHIPRHHRPATAVAWRPTSASDATSSSSTSRPHQIAIGLVSAGGGGGGSGSGPNHTGTMTTVMGSATHSSSSSSSALGVSPPPVGSSSSSGASLVGARRGPGAVVASGVAGTLAAGAAAAAGGRTAGALGSAPGDREYCCFVWDVQHSSSSSSASNMGGQQQQYHHHHHHGGGGTASGGSSSGVGMAGGSAFGRRVRSTPVFKLAHQIGVASLGWVLESGQTLAVGSQLHNLLLYDLRISGTNPQPPASVYAHNFGVHGLEPDPHRPWQFATFCRAANEPVKLWDARMLDTAVSEIKAASLSSVHTATGSGSLTNGTNLVAPTTASSPGSYTTSVSALQWSPTDPGRMLISVGDAIHEYDISSSGSRPTHSSVIHVRDAVLDFCLYPYPKPVQPLASASLYQQLIAELFPSRMMLIHGDRTVGDTARQRVAPVAISRRDGRLVHGFGRALWIGSPAQGPAAMESLEISPDEDISATMMRRARCQHVAKYSMDTTSNIKILAEDGILANKAGAQEQNGPSPTRDALLRLWSWIERVEALCSETEEPWSDWPAKGLMDAGAWRLLLINEGVDDVEVMSDELSCMTYDSKGRR